MGSRMWKTGAETTRTGSAVWHRYRATDGPQTRTTQTAGTGELLVDGGAGAKVGGGRSSWLGKSIKKGTGTGRVHTALLLQLVDWVAGCWGSLGFESNRVLVESMNGGVVSLCSREGCSAAGSRGRGRGRGPGA